MLCYHHHHIRLNPSTTTIRRGEMSSLSSVETKLPPGFRFHPRDDELICDYLMKWISRCPNQYPLLIEVDLNKCEPWDIPDGACVGRKEWYFYSQKDKKYATGQRTNRATVSGYWKATGKDRPITRNSTLVGMRKTLVFYQGRAPKGRKTEWVMHEFRLEGNLWSAPKTDFKEDWVLCRVFFKNRSEIHQSKQEPASSYDITSSQSLATIGDPYVSFDPTYQASTNYQYDEQVPCFSIFTQNQTCPSFPLLSEMDPPEMLPSSTKYMPSFGQMLPDFGLYNSEVSYDSSCDRKMLRDVLDRLKKIESCNEVNNPGSMTKGTTSPSFGEGSSDSYLSEVGLSSMWNQC